MVRASGRSYYGGLLLRCTMYSHAACTLNALGSYKVNRLSPLRQTLMAIRDVCDAGLTFDPWAESWTDEPANRRSRKCGDLPRKAAISTST